MYYLSFLLLLIFVIKQDHTVQADKEHVTRQKQLLHIYRTFTNIPDLQSFKNKSIFPVSIDEFKNPEIIKQYFETKVIPKNGIFSMDSRKTKQDTELLFKLLYSAKDFHQFYKIANWLKNDLNPLQFLTVFTMAILHREDCKTITVPPFYELLPTYFTPMETMLEVYSAKMLGITEGKFPFNNTGYENRYLTDTFGGPLNSDAVGNSESILSYLREDIGLNNWFAMHMLRYPTWMEEDKEKESYWFKRGENYFYTLQQLFAMYTLQRLANGLPYVETLDWAEPIKIGYNPRIAHTNGKALFTRPDNINPKEFNTAPSNWAESKRLKLLTALNSDSLWVPEEDGTDKLGLMLFGMPNKHGRFFGNYYSDAVKALASLPKSSSDYELIGTAMSTPLTMLRDPVYYQLLNNLLQLFEQRKSYYPAYTREELSFDGVEIKDFKIDKLITYFENFDYDLTNAIPKMETVENSFENNYYGRQLRFAHKPYNYKITIKNNEEIKDSMIRIFIGPKYDSEKRLLTLEQNRLTFVEIDRFKVSLNIGENIFERNSKESPLFSQDPESIRNLRDKIEKGLMDSKKYLIEERNDNGMPDRFQLPRGGKTGHPFIISAIVTPYRKANLTEGKNFYAQFGNSELYDTNSLGFPFDRSINEDNFHNMPNIFFKDVSIYHKDENDLNRLK